MKILITGGKGFIARNLAGGLGAGHTVLAPSRAELDLLDAEGVAACLKAEKFDAVIHAATYDAAPKTSVKDPSLVLQNNLRMFFNLARGAGSFGRLIYFGSGAEFGREHWKPRMAEDHFDAHVPSDQYGFSKYLMTKYAMASENIYNLRLFGVFGRYDDWRYRLLPNLCARAALGLPLAVAKNRRIDLLCINDLSAMVKWLLSVRPSRKVYNACSGQVYEGLALAEQVRAVSGKDLPVTLKDKAPGVEYSGDNTALLAESGLKLTPMGAALRELYEWYASGSEKPDREQILAYPL